MLHRKTLAFAVALLAAGLSAGLTARADDKDKKAADGPLDDATFVKMAASDGMHEVVLNKLALTKSTNADIKKFAEQMVKDHTKANEDLKAAAKAAGVEVPAAIMEKHQKHIDMLSKSEHFDQDFAKHMVSDHEEAVALFTKASKELKNKDLKDFATKTLPTLQHHLEMAKKLPQK